MSSNRESAYAMRGNIAAQRDALQLRIFDGNTLLADSSSPVNRTPYEILVSIFRELREQSGLSDQPWTNVASVCRFWRAAAISTPLLWTDIRIDHRMSHVLFQAFLERSDPFPIAVSFASDINLTLDLALMHAHLGRVRTLSFDTTHHSESHCVADLLKKSMPALEKLTVMFNPFVEQDSDTRDEDSDEDDEHEDTDDEMPERMANPGLVPGRDKEQEVLAWRPAVANMPILTELALRGIVLGFGSALSATLTRLELRDCTTLKASLATLNSVLRRCPRLEELIIHRYRCNDERQTPGPRVVLPKTLRVFTLTDAFWYTAYILDTLYVPSTADMVRVTKRVEYDREDSLYAQLHTCLPDNRAACLPILSKVDSVRVDVLRADGSCSIVGRAGPRKIAIDCSAVDARFVQPEIGPDILTLFGNAPLVELVVSCVQWYALPASGWRDVLRGFPLLRRLALIGGRRIRYKRNPQEAFLEALREGRSIRCPNLRELTLCTYGDWKDEEVLEATRACLERRQAHGQRLAVLRLCLVYGTPASEEEGPDLRARHARCTEVLSRFADVVAFPTYDEAHVFEVPPDEEMGHSS